MTLGVCNWIYGNEPLERYLERLALFGYRGAELNGEPAQYDRAELRRLLTRYGLRVPFLTASCDWPTDERDLANPSPEVRARAVAHFKACVDLAAEIGAPGIGIGPQAGGRVRPIEGFQAEWGYAVAATREIARYAESKGIWVAPEALNRYEAFLVTNHRQALDFVAAVDAPNVGVLLDTFHMNIEESTMAATFERVGKRLSHVHLVDSNRRAPGMGHIDFAPILDALRRIGYNGYLSGEFLPLPDDDTAARENSVYVRCLLGRA